MKKNLLLITFLLPLLSAAHEKDSTTVFNLPDSIKAVQFLANIKMDYSPGSKEIHAGIKTDCVSLYLEADKNEKEIVFEYPKNARLMARGINVDARERGEISFDYNWSPGENYKLMISQATDSAGNFSLYSGYVFLTKENKWKLVGTCKIAGRWNTLQEPALFHSTGKKQNANASYDEIWLQRSNGSWKNLHTTAPSPTLVPLTGHIDSIEQRKTDLSIIESAIANRETNVKDQVESVYYKIINPGTGAPVSVNDTVTVYYRLTLLNDTTAVDEAKDKPATFPLKRLIRGWQIGLPLIKVGGEIRLVIPSDLGYSIRTRSPKIPPNSILVFDIRVVDVKAGK